jgi:hypothetical protein
MSSLTVYVSLIVWKTRLCNYSSDSETCLSLRIMSVVHHLNAFQAFVSRDKTGKYSKSKGPLFMR